MMQSTQNERLEDWVTKRCLADDREALCRAVGHWLALLKRLQEPEMSDRRLCPSCLVVLPDGQFELTEAECIRPSEDPPAPPWQHPEWNPEKNHDRRSNTFPGLYFLTAFGVLCHTPDLLSSSDPSDEAGFGITHHDLRNPFLSRLFDIIDAKGDDSLSKRLRTLFHLYEYPFEDLPLLDQLLSEAFEEIDLARQERGSRAGGQPDGNVPEMTDEPAPRAPEPDSGLVGSIPSFDGRFGGGAQRAPISAPAPLPKNGPSAKETISSAAKTSVASSEPAPGGPASPTPAPPGPGREIHEDFEVNRDVSRLLEAIRQDDFQGAIGAFKLEHVRAASLSQEDQKLLGEWVRTHLRDPATIELRPAFAFRFERHSGGEYSARWDWPDKRFCDRVLVGVSREVVASGEPPDVHDLMYHDVIHRSKHPAPRKKLACRPDWTGHHVLVWAVIDVNLALRGGESPAVFYSGPLHLGTFAAAEPERASHRGAGCLQWLPAPVRRIVQGFRAQNTSHGEDR
jgi:hypothetical protein